MKKKNMTVNDMVHIAEDFFTSLGLDPLPEKFWNKSIFKKPTDRKMNCHASAYDFFDDDDFRIKICAKVTMNDLFIIHHEMGHIQYYMSYKNQPFEFRGGANPGFHEALGDVITLSVMTPKHLEKLNLLNDFVDDDEFNINFLLFSALRTVAFAPFALTVENWRWNVFAGKTKPDDYNFDWWRLRCQYQGLVPPVDRNFDNFDAGSKYHIAASVPYDRYFVSLILTFQFHETLCKASGHTGQLHKCDIYKSKEAGDLLKDMLRKGSSVHWKTILEEFTGTDKIDSSSLLKYFDPLYNWLLKQNLTNVDQKWDCESYIDKENRKILSYANRRLLRRKSLKINSRELIDDMFSSSSSSPSSRLCSLISISISIHIIISALTS
jgi:peptidyl-dipeptidase A